MAERVSDFGERMRQLSKDLTAAEQAAYARALIAEQSGHIIWEDIEAAVDSVAGLVDERYKQERERRPGFVLHVYRLEDLMEADGWVSPFVAKFTEPKSWKWQAGELERCNWSAFRKGLIAAKTSANSGAIDISNPADNDACQRILDLLPIDKHDSDSPFSEDYFRADCVPGAIIVADFVFCVAGLKPENSREIAEAIAVHAFCSVDDRINPPFSEDNYRVVAS